MLKETKVRNTNEGEQRQVGMMTVTFAKYIPLYLGGSMTPGQLLDQEIYSGEEGKTLRKVVVTYKDEEGE